MKPEIYETAKGMFKDTNLNITNQGKRHLGAAVGTEEFRKEYMMMRVNEDVAQLKLLSNIAKLYPQAAYCAFTSGLEKSSITLFEPYPISSIYYNSSKMSFDRSF